MMVVIFIIINHITLILKLFSFLREHFFAVIYLLSFFSETEIPFLRKFPLILWGGPSSPHDCKFTHIFLEIGIAQLTDFSESHH